MKLTSKFIALALILTPSLLSTANAATRHDRDEIGDIGIVGLRSTSGLVFIQIINADGEVVSVTTSNDNSSIENLSSGSYTINVIDSNGNVISSSTLVK